MEPRLVAPASPVHSLPPPLPLQPPCVIVQVVSEEDRPEEDEWSPQGNNSRGRSKRSKKECNVDGCTTGAYRYGLCVKHGGVAVCLALDCKRKEVGNGY